MASTRDAKNERWQHFRANRNKALAARHGWLTLTSFAWFGEAPAADEESLMWVRFGGTRDSASPLLQAFDGVTTSGCRQRRTGRAHRNLP